MASICFVGAGKMATAIASGLAAKNMGFSIAAYDPVPAAAKTFESACGGKVCPSLREAIETADMILLAVKPQHLSHAAAEIPSIVGKRLVISIVAGMTTARIAELTGTQRVVRVMPNTPALVGEGMSCIAPGIGASDGDLTTVENIFRTVGRVERIPENLFDAVTGLSGSGPAYVLEFIAALADGGVYAGLPRKTAVELAIQTVIGTARLAAESGKEIGTLRNDVISPAGTTARGVMALAEGAFSAVTAKAVIAAAERSAELGKK